MPQNSVLSVQRGVNLFAIKTHEQSREKLGVGISTACKNKHRGEEVRERDRQRLTFDRVIQHHSSSHTDQGPVACQRPEKHTMQST